MEPAKDFDESPTIEVAGQPYRRVRERLFADQRIGRYRIIGLLGAGGMGEVYRAGDNQLEREVAIKILPPDLADEPEALARFKREAKTVAALSHPNILTIYDFGFDQGFHFAVMELLDGETLASRLQRPMDWREAVQVAIGIADGLAAAHAKGVIHRDVKPDNIFLTADHQVKILDFGIAHVHTRVEPEDVRLSSKQTLLTTPGLLIGSPIYMSPEQVRGEHVEAQSDIFALGSVLHEMITGRRTFERGTVAETLAAVLNGNPPAMAETVEGVPIELEQLVQRCLHSQAGQRFQSARELAAELRAALNARDRTGNLVSRNASQKTRVRWAISVTTIIVLILAMLFVWRALTQGQTGPADSLAILPLSNESGDADLDYVSDGVTETLINSMSQLPQLRVIARTTAFRYKRQNLDPQRAGRELNVRRVFTGRVIRQGDSLSVQVDLINVGDGLELWGGRYDEKLSNLLALPEKISGRISETLQLKLTGAEKKGLTKHYTENTDAYRLYLLGRYNWNKRTEEAIRKSIEYFRQALESDPSYALAYAGLADSYAVLPSYSSTSSSEANLKARAAALKALEIDETLSEAHATLATISDAEWNWSDAEKRFKRAIELKPGYATAHNWFSAYLAEMGRVDEALMESRRAYELDPLSLSVNLSLGANLYIHGDYDQSVEQFKKTLELDPNFVPARIHLVLPLLEEKKFDAAIDELNQLKAITHEAPPVMALLGNVYARSGKKQEAAGILAALTSKPQRIAAFDLAVLYFGLGNNDRAFEYLNKASEERDPLITLINVEPFWAPLRSDPRFQILVRRMLLTP